MLGRRHIVVAITDSNTLEWQRKAAQDWSPAVGISAVPGGTFRFLRRLTAAIFVIGVVVNSALFGSSASAEPRPIHQTVATAGLATAVRGTQVQVSSPPRVPAAAEPLSQPVRADSGSTCATGIEAADLNEYFSSEQSSIFGADYQRANRLPDGRTLWTFQDAFVRRSNGSLKLVHNVGLIQSGNCFSLLRSGTAANPEPWLLPELTRNEKTWHWPMAGEVSADGSTLHVFVVEMNSQSSEYLGKVVPTTNRIVDIRISDLAVVGYDLAPDSSDELFGFDTASDDTWTYLYGHCYKQFGWEWLGHDECAQHVKVARVPKGDVKAAPTYWDGSRWQSNPAAAVSVFNFFDTGEGINQVDVIWDGEHFRLVAMADWWGPYARFFISDSPQGPWTPQGEVRETAKCETCNTYYASWVPWRNSDGSLIWSVSNNRWDGAISSVYRPTFHSFAAVGR